MPHPRINLTVACALLVSNPAHLHAQQSSQPARVRVVELEYRRVIATGTLAAWTGDSVVIVPDDTRTALRRIALNDTRRLEQSFGMQRQTMQGLGLGALAGAVIGIFFPFGKACPAGEFICPGHMDRFGPWGNALRLITPGAVIGALAGSLVVREAWRPALSECQAPRDSGRSHRSWPAATYCPTCGPSAQRSPCPVARE